VLASRPQRRAEDLVEALGVAILNDQVVRHFGELGRGLVIWKFRRGRHYDVSRPNPGVGGLLASTTKRGDRAWSTEELEDLLGEVSTCVSAPGLAVVSPHLYCATMTREIAHGDAAVLGEKHHGPVDMFTTCSLQEPGQGSKPSDRSPGDA
jgi:hypothetical protein